MENLFQLIDTVIKSRLLSYNDEGYEELLQMDIDSFRKRYRDAPEEKLQPIKEAFVIEFDNQDAYAPEFMINAYIKASDVFNSVDFDWGKNKQLASRKKFCLWMFRQIFINNPELHPDTYSPTKEDWELLHFFKPYNEDDRPEIDIIFTMLLTFQIIRPFGSTNTRALKYGSYTEVYERMIALLELLQVDLPVSGAIKHLHSIKKALARLSDPEGYECPLPPAALWGMLNDISLELGINSSPAEQSDSHLELNGYVMKGIWVDDARDNEKRFWIFPNNKLMAFCYYLKNNEWILKPFEFAFSKLDYEFELDNTCVIVTLRGNEQVILNGKIEDEELVRLEYKLEDRDEEGHFQTISFKLENGSEYPYWMNWRSFNRLPSDHPLAIEYAEILERIYYEAEMLHDFYYRNIGSCITDSHDCLVGLDREFLYLSDIALDKGGVLERINEDEDYPLYDYYVRYAKPLSGLNLFGLEISEDQPMYVISRDPLFYAELDQHLNAKSLVNDFPNREDRKSFLRKYEEFKETVMSAEFNDQVTIYKNLRQNAPEVLCFNKISRTFQLKEIIEWFGVRKFTSREEMMKSDIFTWRQRLS